MTDKDKVLNIIKNNTKRLTAKIKNAGLWDWVLSEVKDEFKPFCKNETEILYIALNQVSPLCSGGKSRYFLNLKDGFSARCNLKNNCSCHKDYLKSCEWNNILNSANKKRQITLNKNYGVTNPSKSIKIQNRKIKTNREKFGVDWSLQSEEVKEKIKNTTNLKYGKNSILQTSSVRQALKNYRNENLNDILEKTYNTNNEKYGYSCSLKNSNVQKKSRETCLKKYGVEWYTNSQEMKQKSRETCLKKYGVSNYMQSSECILSIKEKEKIKSGREWNTQRCFNDEIYGLLNNPDILQSEIDLFGVPFLAKQLGISHRTLYLAVSKYNLKLSEKNSYELEISKWLKSEGITFVQHDRTQIKPKELDFYISSNSLAIEFQGTYWHMDPAIFESTDYNLSTHKIAEQHWEQDKKKIELCFSKGIILIIIWERDWNRNKEHIKTFILDTIKELNNTNIRK
jgi:hypothetical protein